ncbi:uncharacterized protein LOC122506183 [Leptopilina heterotoma]|uniref:uncharacterized protein LOC122506183 n=1 Tax=Leptopilina heterotoma TaxID=63436 RepID=UPI001CA9C16A|nr:uncharacterized protein LOC122506183 [Leptopilina heterotoma]
MNKSKIETNGNGNFNYFGEVKNVTNIQRFWKRLEFNEKTFSLILFFFSLIIVIGKIAVNYGYLGQWLFWESNEKSHRFNENENFQFITTNNEVFDKYGWIMKATLSGLATLIITWYIIYKDSNIPGINPPSPFRNSKTRLKKEFEISTNYFMGILNGLLIFFYMCF